jgi:hypothetical protein
MEKRRRELKQMVVNVRNDLWYDIVDYATDVDGYVSQVLADNGTWYYVNKVVEIR